MPSLLQLPGTCLVLSLATTLTLAAVTVSLCLVPSGPAAPELTDLALPSFHRPPPGKSLVTGAQLNFFNKDFFNVDHF